MYGFIQTTVDGMGNVILAAHVDRSGQRTYRAFVSETAALNCNHFAIAPVGVLSENQKRDAVLNSGVMSSLGGSHVVRAS